MNNNHVSGGTFDAQKQRNLTRRHHLPLGMRVHRPGSRLLLWGFQGTLDYRVELTADEFDALDLRPPKEDLELFVTKSELHSYIERLHAMGRDVSVSAGGSPLISSLAAHDWLARHECDGLLSRFIGAQPSGLQDLLRSADAEVVSFATSNDAIGGTLALEHRPASAKLMLAVPDGRQLDQDLAFRGRTAAWAAISALRPSLVGLGIGGLNKAVPSLALGLVQVIRRRSRGCVVFVTGSSFSRALMSGRPSAYWADLNRLFAAADVVSVSQSEWRQLQDPWGHHWVEALLSNGSVGLVVIHASDEVRFEAAPDLSSHLTDVDSVVESARVSASEHAVKALTGIGARFDAVLAAETLRRWSR